MGFGLQKNQEIAVWSGMLTSSLTLWMLWKGSAEEGTVWICLRIIGKLRLEGTSGCLCSNLLLKAESPMRSDQVALGCLQFVPENLPGWRHCNLPWEPPWYPEPQRYPWDLLLSHRLPTATTHPPSALQACGHHLLEATSPYTLFSQFLSLR